MKERTDSLSPAQQEAYEGLKRGLQVGSILSISGGSGRGKSTVLKVLQENTSAAYLNLGDFVAEQTDRHPLQLEETFAQLLQEKMQKHEIVLFDDVHLLDLGHACHFYPRSRYLNTIMMALVA